MGDEKFHDHPITESLSRRALDMAGFKDIHFVSNQNEVEGTDSEFYVCFFIYGVLNNHH